MAKKRFCVFADVPRYGPRDEIVGSTHYKLACFRTLIDARRYARAHYDYDHQTSVCKGQKWCGSKAIRPKKRKRPVTAKQRRAARRDAARMPF